MNIGDAKHQAGEIRHRYDNEVVSRDYMPATLETEMLLEIPGLCDLVYELAEEVERVEEMETQNKTLRHALGVARRAIRNGPDAYGGKEVVMKLCGDVLDSVKKPEETNRGRAALSGEDERKEQSNG